MNINKSEKLLDNAINGCKKWLVASTSSEYGKKFRKAQNGKNFNYSKTR